MAKYFTYFSLCFCLILFLCNFQSLYSQKLDKLDAASQQFDENGSLKNDENSRLKELNSKLHMNFHQHHNLRSETILDSDLEGADSSVTICNDVPHSIPKQCQTEIIKSEAYPCTKFSEKEVCNFKRIEVPGKCYRTTPDKLIYSCPILKEYGKSCYKVPKIKASICKRMVENTKSITCEKQKTEQVCAAHAIKRKNQCFQTLTSNLEYPCKYFERRKKCSKRKRLIQTSCQVHHEKKCEEVEKVIPSLCEEVVDVEEEYSCPRYSTEKVCKDVEKIEYKPHAVYENKTILEPCDEVKTVTLPKKCPVLIKNKGHEHRCGGLNLKHNFKIRSENFDTKIQRQSVENTCNNVDVHMESFDFIDCHEKKTIAEQKMCARTERVSVVTMQPEKVIEQVCYNVSKPQFLNCKRQIKKIVKRDCTRNVRELVCQDTIVEDKFLHGVNALSHLHKKPSLIKLEKNPEVEVIPCEKEEEYEYCELVPHVVDSICNVSVLNTIEKNCDVDIMEQRCEERITNYSSVCLEDVQQEETYPCQNIVEEEKCDEIPIYSNDGVCTININKVEEYDCMRHKLIQECAIQRFPIEHICYKEVPEIKNYSCYEITERQQCETEKAIPIIQYEYFEPKHFIKPLKSTH